MHTLVFNGHPSTRTWLSWFPLDPVSLYILFNTIPPCPSQTGEIEGRGVEEKYIPWQVICAQSVDWMQTKVTRGFVVDIIGHVIYGTVIQEVRTSNIAREVGTLLMVLLSLSTLVWIIWTAEDLLNCYIYVFCRLHLELGCRTRYLPILSHKPASRQISLSRQVNDPHITAQQSKKK